MRGKSKTPAIKKFKAGENLFKAGEKASAAYLIRKGYVTVWRLEDGKKTCFATRTEGELVGEMALVDNARRSATVTAENDLEALVISRREFEMMLKKSPPILAALLCQLFESLRCANDLVFMYAARIAKMGEKTGRSASRPRGKRNDC